MPQGAHEMINPWKLFTGAMIPNWLLERHELSQGAKVVYARLSQYAGRKGCAYPRVQTLANSIGLAERQTQRYLAELKKHELIRVKDFSVHGAASRYYFLSHPWMYEDEVHETTEENAPDPGQSEGELEKENDFEDLVGGGVTSDTGGVSHPTPGECHIRHPIEENQGRDSEEETQSCAGRSHASSNDASPEGSVAGQKEEDPAPCANSAHSMAAVIETAKEKTAAQLRKRADRQMRSTAKKAQLKANLNGKVLAPGIRKKLGACEELFVGTLRDRNPEDHFADWGPKERGQCKQLLDKYPFEVVQAAMAYVTDNWQAIQKRFKVGPVPSLGWLVSMHTSLVPEAQRFARIRAVLDEMDQWAKDHPTDFPPSELSARYDKIKPELKALGIEE